jgi:hypothetical protein
LQSKMADGHSRFLRAVMATVAGCNEAVAMDHQTG